MKDTYVKSGWSEDQFGQFEKHDFEEYYPARFAAEVAAIKHISGKQEKRQPKKDLLDRVLAWIEDEPGRAKAEFEGSAQEVIAKLKEIETALAG